MSRPIAALALFTAFLAAVALILPSGPACAQAPGAQQNRGRTQACFNKKEVEAEAEVRAGLRLREILRRCAAESPDGQRALADWYRFDRDNGDRLRTAVEMRSAAIKRVFPQRTMEEQYANDAVIATQQPTEYNDGVCKSAYNVVDRITKEGWPAYKYYAQLQQNLLVTDIPICR